MNVSRRARRHLTVAAVLAASGAAALFGARGVSSVIAGALTPSGPSFAHSTRLSPPKPPLDSTRVKLADAILRRNPFDSETGSLTGETTPPPPTFALQPCSNARASIVVASDDADWSLAAIVPAPGSPTLLRRRGAIAGDFTVEFIAPDRVWLRDPRGALCAAKLGAALAVPAPAASSSSPRSPTLDPAITRGIERVSPGEYRIDRGVVDRLFEDYANLARGTTVTPDKVNGRVVGMRLDGIRGGSVLEMLGFESGDRILTVNGADLTDPSRAIEAVGAIRSAPRIDIDLSRRGVVSRVSLDVR
jgi:general secretion pathway protein C